MSRFLLVAVAALSLSVPFGAEAHGQTQRDSSGYDAIPNGAQLGQDGFMQQPRKSYLKWVYEALGMGYALIFLVLSTLPIAAFVVAFATRRPAVIAACLPFTAVPALIGMYATAEGIISFGGVATHDPSISLNQCVGAVSTAMFTTLLGTLITLKSLLILSIGLLIRTVSNRPKPSE